MTNNMTFNIAFGKYSAHYRDQGLAENYPTYLKHTLRQQEKAGICFVMKMIGT